MSLHKEYTLFGWQWKSAGHEPCSEKLKSTEKLIQLAIYLAVAFSSLFLYCKQLLARTSPPTCVTICLCLRYYLLSKCLFLFIQPNDPHSTDRILTTLSSVTFTESWPLLWLYLVTIRAYKRKENQTKQNPISHPFIWSFDVNAKWSQKNVLKIQSIHVDISGNFPTYTYM